MTWVPFRRSATKIGSGEHSSWGEAPGGEGAKRIDRSTLALTGVRAPVIAPIRIVLYVIGSLTSQKYGRSDRRNRVLLKPLSQMVVWRVNRGGRSHGGLCKFQPPLLM